jgi:hypothetical protein
MNQCEPERDAIAYFPRKPKSTWNMVRAGMHLEGSGAVRAVTGEAANERMTLWTSQIPE